MPLYYGYDDVSFEYNYDDAVLDVKLSEGWTLHFTFRDDSKCNFINVIQLIDPSNNCTDSLYDPTVCIFGPPFFLLNEALWIIDTISKSSDCTVPQIYALLLPITCVQLTYDSIRALIEQKYKCKLNGRIWNRISICHYNAYGYNGYELDWDKFYPVEPWLQKKYILESWKNPLPQLVTGSFGIPMFPNEIYFSYRRSKST